jgi:hypothetical protein
MDLIRGTKDLLHCLVNDGWEISFYLIELRPGEFAAFAAAPPDR